VTGRISNKRDQWITNSTERTARGFVGYKPNGRRATWKQVKRRQQSRNTVELNP